MVRVGLSNDGGTTSRKPAGPQSLLENIEDELAFGLAGRAAERMVFGNVCAGSGEPEASDLARATRMALGIDTLFGLGI